MKTLSPNWFPWWNFKGPYSTKGPGKYIESGKVVPKKQIITLMRSHNYRAEKLYVVEGGVLLKAFKTVEPVNGDNLWQFSHHLGVRLSDRKVIDVSSALFSSQKWCGVLHL